MSARPGGVENLTKFWMTLFGINFAIGVATGIILEFEFGTNWFELLLDGRRHLRGAARDRGYRRLLSRGDLLRRDVLRLGSGVEGLPSLFHLDGGVGSNLSAYGS